MIDEHEPILLVEDDTAYIECIKNSLDELGINNPLWVVNNGQEAWDRLQESIRTGNPPIPNFIILDIDLPGINGLELLRNMRQDPTLRNTQVFIVSATSDTVDIQAAYRYKASGYFVKPHDMHVLADVLHTIYTYWDRNQYPKLEELDN